MAFTLTVQEDRCLVDGSNLQREISSELTIDPEIKLLDLNFKNIFSKRSLPNVTAGTAETKPSTQLLSLFCFQHLNLFK